MYSVITDHWHFKVLFRQFLLSPEKVDKLFSLFLIRNCWQEFDRSQNIPKKTCHICFHATKCVAPPAHLPCTKVLI